MGARHRIEVVRGHVRLSGEKTVDVDGTDGSTRTLIARQGIVLATGTTATVPNILGLREATPWTSRDVTNLHVVPRRMPSSVAESLPASRPAGSTDLVSTS